MPNDIPAAIAVALGEAVRAYQAAVDDFDRETARLLNINQTDLRCLEILLQDLPQAAPTELASRLGLTTGSVTPMLDRLERRGYLTRSPHPTDRRKTFVQATPKAVQAANALIAPLVTEAAETLLGRYTVTDIKLLIDFMHRAEQLQQRHTARLRATRPRPDDTRGSTPPPSDTATKARAMPGG